jgi:hypothetical protein
MSDTIPNLPMVTMNSVDLAEASPESINNLFLEVFGVDPSLPDWASARANGNWFPSAQLSTKDGRTTGNGVLMWWTISHGLPVAVVVTDAGNVIFVNYNELQELFYPPEYLMREPLYAHIAGVMASGIEIPDEYMFLFEAEFAGLVDEEDFVVIDSDDFAEDFDEGPNPIIVAMMDSILESIADEPELVEDQVYIPSDIDEDFGDAEFGISITYSDGDTMTASFDTVEELNEFMAQRGIPFQV